MEVKSSIILVLAFTLYGLLHSLLAVRKWKLYLSNRFPKAYRYYRFAYSIFAVISLLPILWLVFILPDRLIYRIPPPWVYLTGLVQFGAVMVILIGVFQSGPFSFIGIRQLFQYKNGPEKLRFDGLYRYMRHPIYATGLVFMWLFPIMTGNLLVLWIGITLYLFIGAWLEEQKLLVDYPEYRNYQQQAPMFIPRIHCPPD